MQGRLGKRQNRQTPVSIPLPNGQRMDLNRAAKRLTKSHIAHAQGRSVAQEAREKRKAANTAARRELRQIRKETQRAMRA